MYVCAKINTTEMITTIILTGNNWNNLKHAYHFFKDGNAVVRQKSNGYLLIFNERSIAHKCLNMARKEMLKAGYKFEYKRYNHILINGCKAEINL